MLVATTFCFIVSDIFCCTYRYNTRCVWKLPIVYPLTDITHVHLYSSMGYRVPSDKNILQKEASWHREYR
jgi:hypothetical protein